MKNMTLSLLLLFIFSGCTAHHNPFAHIGASKTIQVGGGINVDVGVQDIIRLGK
ncbi:MAG: hypothetical protein K0U47_06820 [Epsilonproteobacteria bacterium]|nr:hypothetical protein [Campylobacterota bacterium]